MAIMNSPILYPENATFVQLREAVLVAARAEFRSFGYHHGTVAHIAKTLGFRSTAKVYQVFGSKRAVAEAVCLRLWREILGNVDHVAYARSAADHLVHFARAASERCQELSSEHAKLSDMMALAAAEKWRCALSSGQFVQAQVRAIIHEGRRSGEFETESNIEVTTRCVYEATLPIIMPCLFAGSDGPIASEPSDLAILLRGLRARK